MLLSFLSYLCSHSLKNLSYNFPNTMFYNKSRPYFCFFLFISSLPLQFILIWLHAHYSRCVSLALTPKCQLHEDISHSPTSDHDCLLQTFWYLLFLLSFPCPVIVFLILLFSVYTNTDYFKIPCFSLQRPNFTISFFHEVLPSLFDCLLSNYGICKLYFDRWLPRMPEQYLNYHGQTSAAFSQESNFFPL